MRPPATTLKFASNRLVANWMLGRAKSSSGISIPRPDALVWLEYARKLDWDPRREIHGFADLERLGYFSGRVAARRTGASLGAARSGRPADLRVRDRRQHRRAEEPHQRRGFPHRLLALQPHARRRGLSPGEQLADAWPLGSTTIAAGGRTPRAGPRRHLLLRRSRSALGDFAHQAPAIRRVGRLQGPCDRPGADDLEGAR